MILPEDEKVDINDVEEIEKLDGKLGSSPEDEDKLMKTVMENDQEEIDDGKIVNDMMSQGLSSFQPDLAFEQLVQNYKNAERIYGDSLLREATGHSPKSLERNIKIPEFQRDLKSKLSAKKRELEDKNIINSKGEILDHGIALASVQMLASELDTLVPKGITGEHEHKRLANHGMRQESRMYKKGDKFKDLALKETIKKALRRGHKKLTLTDLQTSQREAKGDICLIYGVDASGSMRGKKIAVAKKAGVALAYKATENRDEVGLLIFSDKLEKQVLPTRDFPELLRAMTTIQTAKQTDIAGLIKEATECFGNIKKTKHLILLTDAQSTVGDDPKKAAFDAAAIAQAHDISISVVGIELDPESEDFSRQLVEIGAGKLYIVRNLDDLDKIILYDYESFK